LRDFQSGRIVADERGLYRLSDKETTSRCFDGMINIETNFRDAREVGVAVEGRILDILFPFNECDKPFCQRRIKNSSGVPGS